MKNKIIDWFAIGFLILCAILFVYFAGSAIWYNILIGFADTAEQAFMYEVKARSMGLTAAGPAVIGWIALYIWSGRR